jgi:hypothetical protein
MWRTGVVLWLVALSAPVSHSADSVTFHVALNTQPLIGHPAGPFSVVLILTDGSGLGDANNAAMISDLDLGGGSALGSPLVLGGASGALDAGVALTDGSFLNLFAQAFLPGRRLRFTLSLTTADDDGDTPDRFVLFLVDGSGTPLATLAPAGDFLVGADLTSAARSPEAHRGDASRPPFDGDPIALRRPRIRPTFHRRR